MLKLTDSFRTRSLKPLEFVDDPFRALKLALDEVRSDAGRAGNCLMLSVPDIDAPDVSVLNILLGLIKNPDSGPLTVLMHVTVWDRFLRAFSKLPGFCSPSYLTQEWPRVPIGFKATWHGIDVLVVESTELLSTFQSRDWLCKDCRTPADLIYAMGTRQDAPHDFAFVSVDDRVRPQTL